MNETDQRIATKAYWQWHSKGFWTLGNNKIVISIKGSEFLQPYANLDPSVVLRELHSKNQANIKRQQEVEEGIYERD